jgi:hypothetical protein
MVYPLTIKGYGGGSYNQTTFNLAVEEPFDFDMWTVPPPPPLPAVIWRNSGISPTLTVKNKTTGTPQSVQITYSIISDTTHLPSPDDYNVTITPSSSSCIPNPVCNPPMSISTTRYTPADDYIIYINGISATVSHQINFPLKVKWGCGDTIIVLPEQCEGSDFNGQDCVSLGYSGGGTLSCKSDCTFDTSNCIYCGNNIKEGTEECDGTADAACPGRCIPAGQPNECTCYKYTFVLPSSCQSSLSLCDKNGSIWAAWGDCGSGTKCIDVNSYTVTYNRNGCCDQWYLNGGSSDETVSAVRVKDSAYDAEQAFIWQSIGDSRPGFYVLGPSRALQCGKSIPGAVYCIGFRPTFCVGYGIPSSMEDLIDSSYLVFFRKAWCGSESKNCLLCYSDGSSTKWYVCGGGEAIPDGYGVVISSVNADVGGWKCSADGNWV